MFMTRPNDRYPLPKGLAEPGADYWRSLNLATNAAWYILTVRPPTDEYLQTTVLVRSETDIADAIEASQPDIASLLCIAPPTFDGENDGWTSFAVAEVWRAIDPDENDIPCVVFVAIDGREHSGLLGEPKSGLKKTRLIARISRGRAAANDAVGHCD
jgi:hypothetical protein